MIEVERSLTDHEIVQWAVSELVAAAPPGWRHLRYFMHYEDDYVATSRFWAARDGQVKQLQSPDLEWRLHMWRDLLLEAEQPPWWQLDMRLSRAGEGDEPVLQMKVGYEPPGEQAPASQQAVAQGALQQPPADESSRQAEPQKRGVTLTEVLQGGANLPTVDGDNCSVRVTALGDLPVPSGRLIACDPLWLQEAPGPFHRALPAGQWPVSASVADVNGEERRRDQRPVREGCRGRVAARGVRPSRRRQ